jgi:nucleoside-diphosphate-sugar epimerase
MSKRVLISGITGFTGHYVQKKFTELGYEVYGFGSHTASVDERIDIQDKKIFAIRLHETAKLCDLLEQIQPNVIIHLAAISFVAHGIIDDIYSSNISGTYNLLQAIKSSGCTPESVILASSANVYGNSPVSPLTEDSPMSPENDYAVSKMAMEAMASLWMDKLPITIVRPFNYTGVGQSDRFLIPKIVGHFQRREKLIELGNIDVVRDFSDVRTVAEIYFYLAQGDYSGETFNICSGIGSSLAEIIAILSDMAGYQIDVRVNPDFVRDNEVKRLIGSGMKLSRGFESSNNYSISDTLLWMYENKGS